MEKRFYQLDGVERHGNLNYSTHYTGRKAAAGVEY